MSPTVAALIFCLVIVGLFWLDRDPRSRTSVGLWIVWAWFFLACSRPLSAWLDPHRVENRSISTQLVEGSPTDRAALTGLLVLGIIVLVTRRQRAIKSFRSGLPVALFFGYCLISLLWSDFPDVGIKRWNKALGDWVMVMIVWTETDPLAALKRLIARITYLVIPISILFIKYYGDLGRNYDYLGFAHYTGVTREKNTLGSLCLLFGLSTLWAIIGLYRNKGPRRLQRFIVQGVILAMIIWMFTILDAMTAMTCFGLASTVLFASNFKTIRKFKFAIHCVTAIAIAIPVAVTIFGFSPGTLQQLGRNPTLTDRTGIWQGVIRLTPNKWLGAGFESFWLGPRLEKIVSEVTYWWVPNQAHNGYIEAYANLGWIGIVLLTAVILWGYRRIIEMWRGGDATASLMLAWFVTGVIFNLTEAAFFRMMIPVWLFFLMAITIPRISQEGAIPEKFPVAPEEMATLVVADYEAEPLNVLGNFHNRNAVTDPRRWKRTIPHRSDSAVTEVQ